jgi:teichuronic acid biosynthesis glycosyltransferase TuaH
VSGVLSLAEATGVLDGDRADLLVYLATGWWDGSAGTDRQLVTALSRNGPVLFVEPPVSALTRIVKPHLASMVHAPRLRIASPRLALLNTLVAPGMTRPMLRHLRAPMIARALRLAIGELYVRSNAPVAGIVSSRLDEAWPNLPTSRRLLYATDDLIAGADLLGLPRRRLVRLERAALQGADVVATVSPILRQRYENDGFPAELVPNGCEPEFYADVDTAPPPADVRPPGGPVAGFLGYINNRIDLALLEAVADTGSSLLIVGALGDGYRSPRFAALVERPNVCWTGPRPYEEMPSYMRIIDVGLTPYADNPFNRASFPLKTLEYLAAGRAVVATELPANTWLGTDLIAVANGPAEFSARVVAELAMPRTPKLAARRRTFAEQHSWGRRAARITELLNVPELDSGQPTPKDRPLRPQAARDL